MWVGPILIPVFFGSWLNCPTKSNVILLNCNGLAAAHQPAEPWRMATGKIYIISLFERKCGPSTDSLIWILYFVFRPLLVQLKQNYQHHLLLPLPVSPSLFAFSISPVVFGLKMLKLLLIYIACKRALASGTRTSWTFAEATARD